MRRINIKQKLCSYITILAMMFQFFSFLPIFQVNAEENITEFTKFITNVSITDGNNNPISGPIKNNADVKLQYNFELPNEHNIKKDQSYIMHIPKEFEIINQINFSINDDSGEVIANGTIDIDGKVTIVFTEFVEQHSNISGYFFIETKFDEKVIGGNDKEEIEFDLGGSGNSKIIEVDFEQPEKPDASIHKKGSYDASTNEITWEIIVNPENVKIEKANIIDVISERQEFVVGSVKINGQDANNKDYGYNSNERELTYTFPDTIETKQIITFKTKLASMGLESHGKTIVEKNQATFTHDDTTVVSNEATVVIKPDFIQKTGKYDEDTKTIKWTIKVNNSSQTITNAVVTDDIPQGLKFIDGSVKVDGKEDSNYNLKDQKFTYTFPGTIKEPHTIEFLTDVVDKDIYLSNEGKNFNNTATITDNGNGSASDGSEVRVYSSVISKHGKGYDPSTGEITWEIVVNRNKIDIENAVVSDDIIKGQEYVENSFKIYNYSTNGKEANGEISYKPSTSDDSTKTGTLMYEFKESISDTYIITFKTKVTDKNVYAGNANTVYSNKSKLTGKNIKDSESTAEQKVISQVINKSSIDYDYVKREITWEIVVNKNNMPLSNVSVIDVIKEGQEFVPNSVTINGAIDTSNYNYDEGSKTLRYTFDKDINKEQIITFKTKVTDTSIFNTNGEKVVENTSKLITNLVPGGVESTGTGKIKNTLVKKEGKYTKGNSYIDWDVTINSNKISMKDVVLEDVLQEGLELDTTSVKLYKQNQNSDGSLTKGEEVELGGNNVKYDMKTRKFTFTLPSPTVDAYILAFRTNVVDKTKSPFSNSISFKGTGLTESSTSNGIDVIYQGAGGGGIGETGSIKVIKVNNDNESIKLKGAIFELLDKYKNVIKTSEPTGNNGDVVFKNLKFGIDYYIKEKTAPEGYLLSDEVYKFQIANSKESKSITYNYKNISVKGDIIFNKLNENEKPLRGAEFTLYKASDISFESPIDTSISDKNGDVKFKDIDYGEYVIKETKAPTGYTINEKILKATINENGKVVTANPDSVSNTKIRGSIEFTKLGEDNEPLKGAEFKLYKASDKNFEDEIATAESDDAGKVVFENIEYGDYVIKETKAPEGYELSNKILKASIVSNGKLIKANPESISNTKTKGSIEFTKLGEHEDKLKGAEFKLYMSSDTDFKDPVATAISNIDGLVKFKNVEYGEYVIKESKAPEGYVSLPEDKVLKATVTEDKKIVKAEPNSISNKKIRGSIEFTKYGDNKEPLKGAEFKLYKASDKNYEKEIDTAESNDSGKVVFGNIEYGDYIIKETKAPDGYELTNKILKASITSNGKLIKANPESISNTKTKGSIEFTKLGENKERLKGAEFTLYRDSDKKPIDKAISDRNGLVKFKNVEYGKYIIKETKAPVGYLKSDKVLEATVTESNKVVTANPDSVSNTKIRGSIEFKKLGDNKEPLKGAEFKLYKSSDKNYEKEIATAESDDAGKVVFENIEYGDYAIKETKAPEGYELTNKILNASITSNGKTIKANPESISNTKTKGSIEFTKLGEHEEKLKGAEFKLYKKSDTKFKSPISTAVSDRDGLVKFKNVEYGEYVIKESKAPEGYVLLSDDKVLEATVSESNKVVTASPDSVSNTKIRGSIEFKKLGDNKEPLKGAEFKLYKASDKNYEKAIATAKSNEVGKVIFENIEYGNYVIKETKAPEGYELTNKILKASIVSNGKLIKANPESISNTKTKGSIEFTKLGENKERLKGAEFTLYRDSDKKPIDKAISDRNGLVKFKNVEYGKYIIKESKAPAGYLKSDEVLEATVSESNKVVTANPDSISNDKIKANIIVTKIDEKTKKTLEGAEFTLYDADGKEVKTSVSGETGIVYFNSVEYGNYKIKETKAPDGYMISKDIIEVKVKTTGTKEFTVTNKEKEVVAVTKDNTSDKNGSLVSKDNILGKLVSALPKTGSLFDTIFIISIGSLTILAGLGFLLKRNR